MGIYFIINLSMIRTIIRVNTTLIGCENTTLLIIDISTTSYNIYNADTFENIQLIKTHYLYL